MLFLQNRKITSCQRGFTLLELLIVVAITSVLMIALSKFFDGQQKSYYVQEEVAEMQQNLRASIDIMVRDLRKAGYKMPTGTTTVGVTSASSNTMTITFDDDGNNVVSAAETITYDLNNFTIRKDNNPIAENIVALSFAYAFDDDGDGLLEKTGANDIWAVDSDNDGDLDIQIDGTALPAGDIVLNKIRAVQVWVLVRPEKGDVDYFDSKTYAMGSQNIVPNDNYRHRMVTTIVKLRNMGL